MSNKKKIILIIFGLLVIVIAGVVYVESTKTCCAPPPFQNQVFEQFSKSQANFEIIYTKNNGTQPPEYYREDKLTISTNQEGSVSAISKAADYKKVLEEKPVEVTKGRLLSLIKTASEINPKSDNANSDCTGGSTKSLKISQNQKVLLETSNYICSGKSTNKPLEEFSTQVESLLSTDIQSIPEKECLDKGGKWGKFGLSLNEECNLPTSDEGKKCTDGSECEGSCLGDSVGVSSGKCSKWTIVKGCYPFVSQGKAQGMLCAD